MRILVAEDDAKLPNLLRRGLTEEGRATAAPAWARHRRAIARAHGGAAELGTPQTAARARRLAV